MKKNTRVASALVCGMAVLVCTACASGTYAAVPAATSENKENVIPSHILSVKKVQELSESLGLNHANMDSTFVESTGPVPTYQQVGGKRESYSIHNRSESAMDPGTYTLRANCIGTGSIDVTFVLGDQTKRGTVQCDSDISTYEESIETSGSNVMEVMVVPSHGSKAEFAYRVDRK